jgi:hypothetical protein
VREANGNRRNQNPNAWSPAEAWRRFRLEAEAAKNYPLSYSMYISQTHRDVLLERLLPALLYIKAVAILDDSLELWLDTNGYRLVSPYRNDLNGRLDYLKDNNLLGAVAQLHDIRRRRNALAHGPDPFCDWRTLERDISTIESGLVFLGLARPSPKLDYYCERSAMQDSTEPGVKFFRTFTYGVKEDGKAALEVTWTQKFHDD